MNEQRLTYQAERQAGKSAPQFNWIMPDIVDIIKLDPTQAQKLLKRAGNKIINSQYYRQNFDPHKFVNVDWVCPQKPKKYTLHNWSGSHNGGGLIVSTYNSTTGKGRACMHGLGGSATITMSMNNWSWNDETLLHEIAHINTNGHDRTFRNRLLQLTGYFRSHAYQEILFRSFIDTNASVNPIRHSQQCVDQMKLTMEGFIGVDFKSIAIADKCTYTTNNRKEYKERLVWQSEFGVGQNHWTKITDQQIAEYKSKQMTA